MASIYDVAKAAGTSIATVSRVLNGNTRVRDFTRQQVLKAVAELDYHPNTLAQSLVRKTTRTVALVVPDISNPFFPEVARGVEDMANQAGYNVILCNSDDSTQKEIEYCRVMRTRRVDGLIFALVASETSPVKTLLKAGVPVVLIDRDAGGLTVDAVVTDNLKGGMTAAHHLVGLGHTRIGCITGPLSAEPAASRLNGFRQVLEPQGLFRSEYVVEGDFRQSGGYLGMKRLLELPEPPTAVFACNDMMALGAMAALDEAGRRVPQDVALVGYDDILVASLTRPQLTTVAQPKYEMGWMAMEVLLKRIAQTPDAPQRVVLQPRLVVRGSTVIAERRQ
ncbi:MAG TPA: LacI family transcriptional regulator [Firmicutes bacterium]|nr:LacI family transcriptional regulator [Bacillota bacterium]